MYRPANKACSVRLHHLRPDSELSACNKGDPQGITHHVSRLSNRSSSGRAVRGQVTHPIANNANSYKKDIYIISPGYSPVDL